MERGLERRSTTVYLWELAWILPSLVIPVGMLVALAVTAFGAGIHLPGDQGRIDPQRVAEHPLFKEPGVVQIAPGQYEVRLTAQIWAFTPNEIRVPAGSTVHFWATSKDVIHGLLVPKHNINVMLLPGQIAHAQARFDTPGEYPIICHEYCGIAHHTMAGKIIVEERKR
jgi:cytochrome c oxidase subunit II